MEKKPSAIDARIKRQQDKLLEALAESGNVSFACKRAGVSRDTYYRWRKEDEGFADKVNTAIASGKEFVNDLAHSQLIRNIQNGDMGAIKFQLGNCHEDLEGKITGVFITIFFVVETHSTAGNEPNRSAYLTGTEEKTLFRDMFQVHTTRKLCPFFIVRLYQLFGEQAKHFELFERWQYCVFRMLHTSPLLRFCPANH